MIFEWLDPFGTLITDFGSGNYFPKIIIHKSECGQISAPDNEALFLQ